MNPETAYQFETLQTAIRDMGKQIKELEKTIDRIIGIQESQNKKITDLKGRIEWIQANANLI